MYKNAAYFGNLLTIDGASITSDYELVGTIPNFIVEITFKNITDGDVLVSLDGVNDMLDFPKQSYSDKDVRCNSPLNNDLMFPVNTSIYVKSGTSAPASGRFSVESLIAQPASL